MTFHDIQLKVATNFNTLSYVYVIKNRLEKEVKQLEETPENKTPQTSKAPQTTKP
jgi:rod shape-determining protein MreC